jgi:hypothetical protein
MRAIVLLPAGASWRPFALVGVLGRGEVEPDLPYATGMATQVELELHAEDDALEDLRVAVGERAIELGGIALDARLLEPLVEPGDVPADPPTDDGPIWEHLPGEWNPGPATGEVVDANRAIEQIEQGIAVAGIEVPLPPPGGTLLGLRLWLDRLRGRG